MSCRRLISILDNGFQYGKRSVRITGREQCPAQVAGDVDLHQRISSDTRNSVAGAEPPRLAPLACPLRGQLASRLDAIGGALACDLSASIKTRRAESVCRYIGRSSRTTLGAGPGVLLVFRDFERQFTATEV
jgi:hypothetical protein